MTQHCEGYSNKTGQQCRQPVALCVDGKYWCYHHYPPNAQRLRDETKARRERAKACVAFFHGRDIATEGLEEGGFWEMVEFIKNAQVGAGSAIIAGDAYALLSKLGIEP